MIFQPTHLLLNPCPPKLFPLRPARLQPKHHIKIAAARADAVHASAFSMSGQMARPWCLLDASAVPCCATVLPTANGCFFRGEPLLFNCDRPSSSIFILFTFFTWHVTTHQPVATCWHSFMHRRCRQCRGSWQCRLQYIRHGHQLQRAITAPHSVWPHTSCRLACALLAFTPHVFRLSRRLRARLVLAFIRVCKIVSVHYVVAFSRIFLAAYDTCSS